LKIYKQMWFSRHIQPLCGSRNAACVTGTHCIPSKGRNPTSFLHEVTTSQWLLKLFIFKQLLPTLHLHQNVKNYEARISSHIDKYKPWGQVTGPGPILLWLSMILSQRENRDVFMRGGWDFVLFRGSSSEGSRRLLWTIYALRKLGSLWWPVIYLKDQASNAIRTA
jgi:hypothetical protein